MNIELDKSNIKIEGNKLVIELTEELKSALCSNTKVLKACSPGTTIIDNIGNKWLVIRHDSDGSTKVWRKELLDRTYRFDLTSLDGLDTYGTCKCKVHLGTIDDYRYARKIGMFRVKNKCAFWLDTPDSTKEGLSASYVRVVYGCGNCGYDDCDWGDYGVRPFISLDSTIVVSEE